jgi:hypothetical protein
MKQVQLNEVVSGLTIDATEQSTGVDVSKYGPTSVAIQISVSAQSSANFTAQLAGSLDGTNYFVLGSTQNITANGEIAFSDTAPAWRFYRINFVRTGGSFTAAIRTFVYGETV